MERAHLVIAGGGLAAARAAASYRDAGGEGRVVLVGGEPVLPYHRPPLSKRYLRGELDTTPYVEDDAFYAERDVDVLLSTSVVSVDPGARTATLAGGGRLGYERLLLATGATPRRLEPRAAPRSRPPEREAR